jgi:hypothetical protein
MSEKPALQPDRSAGGGDINTQNGKPEQNGQTEKQPDSSADGGDINTQNGKPEQNGQTGKQPDKSHGKIDGAKEKLTAKQQKLRD